MEDKLLRPSLALIMNTYYTDKLIKIGFFMQMRDLLPSLIMSLSMGLIVHSSLAIIRGLTIKLFLEIGVGLTYYILIGLLSGSQDLHDILCLFRTSLRKLYAK